MSNDTYYDVEYGNLDEYEIQTLAPQWDLAFEFATGVWLVLLCIVFRPVIMFLQRQKQEQQELIQHDGASGTCDCPCTGGPCAIFIAMEEEEDEGDDDDDDISHGMDSTHHQIPHRHHRRDMPVDFMEPVGCMASDMVTDLDIFEHKETFQMIQHLTEDKTHEEIVAILNTSILNVGPLTRRYNFLYRTNGNDIDADSDVSVATSSESDDDDNAEKYDIKYSLGYSWDEIETQYPNYRKVSWTNLPSPVMRAARTLGFSRKLWDSGQAVPVSGSKAWNERDRQEKAACGALGIDKAKWNLERDRIHSVDFPFRNWNELPQKAQLAATYLGYDQEQWDADIDPPCGEIPWNKLSKKQRDACRVLGFDQNTWDGTSSQRHPVDSISSGRKNKCDCIHSKFFTSCELLALDHETHRLVKLAIPATLANIIIPILVGTKKISILIWMGPYQYLSWAMSNYFLDWCDCLTAGFAESEKILCVQAISMKKYFLAGQYVQLISLFHVMVAITSYGIVVILVGQIYSLLAFGDMITLSAKDYIPLCATARLVQGSCVRGIERLMEIEGKGKPMLIIDAVARAFQLLGIIVAVAAFKSESLLTIGILEICSAVMHVVVTCSLCAHGWLAKYDGGLFGNWAMSNGSLARAILKMTWPLTVGRFMVHGEWRVLTLLAAYMGPGETVVWTLTQAVWDVVKEFPTGMIIAAEVRMRGKLRVGRPDLAKLVAYKSFLYIFLLAVLVDAIFLAFLQPVLALLIPDATFREMAYHLVMFMCVGNVVLAIGSNAQSNLVTQHRAKTAVMIFYLSIFGITIPMATWLVVGRHYGLESVLMSCVFGYTFMTFCMLIFVSTTKWPKIQEEVYKRTRNRKRTDVSKRRRSAPSLAPFTESVQRTK